MNAAGVIGPDLLALTRQWSIDSGRTPPSAIDRNLVHKNDSGNVLLSRVERLDVDDGNNHVAQMLVDPAHPFFFEHPIDHVPGLMLIEAARQLAVVVAHIEFRVPFGTPFVLNDLGARFVSFAELQAPTFIHSVVVSAKHKQGRLIEMVTTAAFIQDETVLGTITGRGITLRMATQAQ